MAGEREELPQEEKNVEQPRPQGFSLKWVNVEKTRGPELQKMPEEAREGRMKKFTGRKQKTDQGQQRGS